MNKSIVALLLFLIFILLGLALWDIDPNALNKEAILHSPSLEHPFGTDILGRDVFARVLFGSYNSLMIGILSSLIATLVAIIVGVSAGYYRGGIDKAIVIGIDLFLTFPTFFLLLALIAYIDASLWVLVVVISITGWMGSARLIRSESYRIVSMPYIKILNIAKINHLTIIFKYIAPSLAPIVLVSFTFGVAGAILAESSLSFLGLGITSPEISWGLIISEGKDIVDIAWWISFFPGVCILVVTFLLISLSDDLQKRLNQKSENRIA